MQALYTHEGRDIFEPDFSNALQQMGVLRGDTIFVHSDTRVFGKIVENDRTMLLRSLVRVLEASVGLEGTLVMPTFSYSFCKGEAYDKAVTRSTVGALTEFFRKEPGVERSVHGIFSVASWGRHQSDFLLPSKDSFGEGTVFDTLHRLNGKIVLFGVDFQAATFMHHIEQMHAVPYRFMKTFKGTTVDGSASYEDAYTYFVRPIDGTIENDFNVIEPLLRAEGILREVPVGAGKILVISARELYEEGMSALDRNPYLFVTKSPTHS